MHSAPERIQFDKFKNGAHPLEADDDPKRFKERLNRLVTHSREAVERADDLVRGSNALIRESKKLLKRQS